MLLNRYPSEEEFCKLTDNANVIPVCVEILADMETPVSLLKKFYNENAAVFLLESVEGGERWGRYSFLGTSARYHVRVYREHVEIREGQSAETIPHHGDPLRVLKDFMQAFHPAEMSRLPRFWGGLVGYLTYEMVSFFEKIPHHLPEDKPLAEFIIPDRLIIFDNVQNSLIALALAFTDKAENAGKAYADAQNALADMLRQINGYLNTADETTPGICELQPLIPADEFRAGVKKIKEYIFAGDVIQTVISQPFTCKATMDEVALYRAQRYINPSPYLYFMNLNHVTMVGSSPETMVRLEKGTATVRPIAGTRPRGASEQEDRAMANDLLSDEKEKAEHLMLVDLGRNDLGRIAETGTVQVTDLMVVERYSHVMHLVSNVQCQLQEDKDCWDLLRATFPAGTLSGAPKIRAMEIIAELEKTPRGPYGGAIGYISFSGNMDLAITIRTAIIENGTLTVQAGAGIVADSDPEKERIETMNKARALQKAIELVQRDHY